eukprot:2411674-Amphidinium_carterae.1
MPLEQEHVYNNVTMHSHKKLEAEPDGYQEKNEEPPQDRSGKTTPKHVGQYRPPKTPNPCKSKEELFETSFVRLLTPSNFSGRCFSGCVLSGKFHYEWSSSDEQALYPRPLRPVAGNTRIDTKSASHLARSCLRPCAPPFARAGKRGLGKFQTRKRL